MTEAPPLIFAVASGKGGVGKTMLSAAIARELAESKPVLVLDLDFFNRGLTGLLGKDGRLVSEVSPPKFIETSRKLGQWQLLEVCSNIFCVQFPDLDPQDIRNTEFLNVMQLEAELRDYITEACTACGAEFVVLDCHGGPDSTSFAACALADHSILVSEPDRITLYGTLHFLRQAQQAAPDKALKLHLVFNKVLPAFSGLFLRRLYDNALRDVFGGQDLLAMFPMEVYLTKEFEKTPFLTDVYPYSLLAQKTRVLLLDLLGQDRSHMLSAETRDSWPMMNRWRRNSLGKTFPLLNINIVVFFLVAVSLVIGGLGFLSEFATDLAYRSYRGESDLAGIPELSYAMLQDVTDIVLENAPFLIICLFVWFLSVVFYTWIRLRDRELVYSARRGFARRLTFLSVCHYISMALPVFFAGLAVTAAAEEAGPVRGPEDYAMVMSILIIIAGLTTVAVLQAHRLYVTMRYRFLSLETFYRIGFCGIITLAYVAGTASI